MASVFSPSGMIDQTDAFPYVFEMTSILAREASKKLHQLLEKAADSHEPIKIMGQRASGILISEADWLGIQETLYLFSIPGVRESIRTGMEDTLGECSGASRQVTRKIVRPRMTRCK